VETVNWTADGGWCLKSRGRLGIRIVDCIIELDASQVKGVAVRRLRVKKMRGRNFSDSWIQFEIKPERGIDFLI
jgi:KaiC/GvpD/RAD55 family RecA-like ATPase